MIARLYLISFLFITSVAFPQKEFWGMTTTTNSLTDFGTIFKTDTDGQNRQLVYTFDEVHGKHPKARLFLASNGKLYGTASKGGSFYTDANEGGVLFEYDLVFDRYRVVANFGGNGLSREPFTDVIEPIPGVLFGASLFRVFRYDMESEVTTISITMPEYNNGSFNLINNVNNQFMQASDGFLYGVTTGAAGCIGPSTQAAGTIIKINPQDNTYSQPYIFPCYPVESGYYPIGSLVEGDGGKLYGTTEFGGANDDGVLFEFDTATNTYTKKFDFEELVSGKSPRSLINGGNGKLYGITLYGGTNPCNTEQHFGTLFEYDLTTQTLTTVINMGCDGNFSSIIYPHSTLLKASTGLIFGVGGYDLNYKGIFKFDPATNTAVNACPLCPGIPNLYIAYSEGLIEVCRKPSYPYIENDTYTICEGESFTYDLNNANATGYTWKKNNQALTSQQTGILSLSDLEIADSGDYTCEMVNECGTTITMPIHLTVEACMGLDEAIGYKNAISLYPNPAQNSINVKLPENIKLSIKNVCVLNMLGQEIHMNSGPTTEVDISSLSEGMYILKLTTQQGNWVGKFIKQ